MPTAVAPLEPASPTSTNLTPSIKASFAAWKVQFWTGDHHDKTAAEVAANVRADGLNNRNCYLLSYRCHLSTYPVCAEDDRARATLRMRSGGYARRENYVIRREFDLQWRWPELPRIKLDAELQAHYLGLERYALTTCHPLQICQQSMELVAAVSGSDLDSEAPEDSEKTKSRVADLARAVYAAGTADMNSMRSIAVLAHQLALDLETTSPELKHVFLHALVNATFSAFFSHWRTDPTKPQPTDIAFGVGNGLALSMSQSVNHARVAMLNSAAFLANLYAMGLIEMVAMREAVWLLVKHPRSLLHLRALCLVLSQCVYVVGRRFDRDFYDACAKELGMRLAEAGGMMDPWAQRWRIESCRLMELMLDQIGQDTRTQDLQRLAGQVVKQNWTHSMTPEKVFRNLAPFLAACKEKTAD